MLNSLLCVVVAVLLLFAGFAAEAAESDSAVYVELQPETAGSGTPPERWKLYGASHALVIGIDEYSAGWPRLSYAVRDAEAVAAALRERGFEVATLLNPTGDKLRSELRNFFAFKGADPDARLFIWFAGHGFSELGEGYLVPADAPAPDEPAFRALALHMGDVGSMVRIARSKHVFAVFDSCFAGTIFNAGRSRPPSAVTRAVAEPVRQFLTSGDADQVVSDDGAFRSLFLQALSGEENADANRDGYLTATELSLFLEDRVVNLTNSLQTPRSGKLRDRRFDKGDFVFLLPGKAEEIQVAAAAPPADSEAGTRALPRVDGDLAVELAFWDAIKSSDSIADYQAYLTAFPEGRFGVLAEARRAELEARAARQEEEQERVREDEARRQAEAESEAQLAALPPEPQANPAEQTELALGLNRSDRKELQAALTALGFDTKGVDGFFGPGTRAAIKGYQASKGSEQTGFLTASLASQLVAEAPEPAREEVAALPSVQPSEDAAQAARIRELEAEIATLRESLAQSQSAADPAYPYDGTWTGQVVRRSCASSWYSGGAIEVRVDKGNWVTVSAPLPDFAGPIRGGDTNLTAFTTSGHEANLQGAFSEDGFAGGVKLRTWQGMCRLDVEMTRQAGADSPNVDDLAERIATLQHELESLKAQQ